MVHVWVKIRVLTSHGLYHYTPFCVLHKKSKNGKEFFFLETSRLHDCHIPPQIFSNLILHTVVVVFLTVPYINTEPSPLTLKDVSRSQKSPVLVCICSNFKSDTILTMDSTTLFKRKSFCLQYHLDWHIKSHTVFQYRCTWYFSSTSCKGSGALQVNTWNVTMNGSRVPLLSKRRTMIWRRTRY